MIFDRWQAPDRDSPTTLSFSAIVELGTQLDALFKTEGRPGTREDAVQEASGAQISRPRRWHKMFERMGLLFQDADGNTQLTQLGVLIRDCKTTAERDFRRGIASHAIAVLRKYQLLNPADITETDTYPPDTDCHPYWAIWKAAAALDGKLHWDELNRELMWVLRQSELDSVIDKIRNARAQPEYDPATGGGLAIKLRDRAYDQTETTDNRDPSGQVRDQKTTPWFKRAGLGELLLVPPGRTGNGYWSIHPDVIDLISAEVLAPPEFKPITDKQEWFDYFGKFDLANGAPSTGVQSNITSPSINYSDEDSPLPTTLPDTDSILTQVREIMSEGAGGVLFSGPPGTSKSWYARQIAGKITNGDSSRVRFIQFHPSMGYDDFVEGYVPTILDGVTSFTVKKKTFLKICETAAAVAPEPCILVIDELNRGDTGRIFGEVLTYIEPSYRGKTFRLSYSGLPAQIPSNLFIIGTFNPFDKSVVELDDAIDRRFDRISLEPSATILNELLTEKGTSEALRSKVISYFIKINKATKHGLGHALFSNIYDDRSLASTWNRKLKFILEKAFRFEPDAFDAAKQDYMALFEAPESSGI